jgi:hypothetical protein
MVRGVYKLSNLKQIELVLDGDERKLLVDELNDNLAELRLDIKMGIRCVGDEKLVKLYEYLINKVKE